MPKKTTTAATIDAAVEAPALSAPTKKARLITRLQDPAGTTVAELSNELGWLPHTVRAALTGLRKAGHAIERGTRADGATTYTLRTEA